MVFVKAPQKPHIPEEIALLSLVLERALNNKPATIPIMIRGRRQTMIARGLPLVVPSTGTNGENTNEVTLGLTVFLIILVMPNTPPRNAPFFQPKRIAPMITGI